ncbi:MAG: HAD family phosphatase, partial [Deltaproteobacteria bacterium]|nr:HAD family phosphatase [Deltaproteobacteria bacterium]
MKKAVHEIKRPEGVIFDLGGVLLAFDHMDVCRALGRLSGKTPDEVYGRIFKSGLEEAYDKGLPTWEFYHEALKRLGMNIPFDEFSRIWCGIFTEKNDVIEILASLKGRTRLFLLSNTNELHFEFARKKFPFLDNTFDALFLSYRLGLRKPEPEIYEAVIISSGIDPSNLFFTDDKPDYADAAKK